jgi:uncharacterized protein involved in exopolysaccharide biosynthesis/beta-lactamase regulating signal transducer with metallopeptidase domain
MSALGGILSEPLAQRLGWVLLHSLWQGAFIAGLFGLLRAGCRDRSPQVRYRIGSAALLSLAVLPILTFCWLAGSSGDSGSTYPWWLTAGSAGVASSGVRHLGGAFLGLTPRPLIHSSLTVLGQVAPILPAAWLLGVALFSLRLTRSCWWTRSLRRRADALLDPELIGRLNDLRLRLGISRPVRLLKSALVEVPTVVGWLRPVILLPAATLVGLPPHQLDAILAHELAHIQRLDYLVNAFQCVLETLMFYHPVVWWTSACVREERENCCDDLVVAVCGDRLAYAHALATLEESRAELPELALAASGGSLLRRIQRLLGAADLAGPTSPQQLAGLSLLGLSLALILTGACLLLAPAKYSTIARIKLERDQPAGDSQGRQFIGGYDPYFIQQEFEVLQSEVVLGRVIRHLDLGRLWGQRYGAGRPVSSAESLALLKQHLDLRPIRNTSLVEIRVWAEDRDQAAAIANGVADAYREYRGDERLNSSKGGLAILEDRFRTQEAEVRLAQDKVDKMRQEMQIPEAMVNADGPTTLLTAESLRRIEGLRIDSQARLVEQETLLSRLQSLRATLEPLSMAEVIPSASQDSLLQALLEQSSLVDQNLAAARVEHGPEHPQVIKAAALVDDLHKKIQSRVDAFFLGMQAKVDSLKVGLKTLEDRLAEARSADIKIASLTQPYFQAKRELEEKKQFQHVLYMKLASEKVDASLPRSVVEIVDRAVAPPYPVSPNRPAAGLLILLGFLMGLAGLLLMKRSSVSLTSSPSA